MNIVKGIQERPQRVCLYGPEGIGKTSLAAKWPNPLYFDLESGTSFLDVDRVTPPTWNMLVADIMQAQTLNEYQTIVVDTLDAAEKLCIQEVCRKNKKDSIEAFGYGKGYTYVMEEFARLLGALDQCVDAGKNVVVVAHAMMRKFEQPDEAAPYDRWELKLSKKVSPIVKEWCDALLFLNYETMVEMSSTGKAKARGGRRIMQVDHHPCWDAKNRWGLTGKLPMEFEIEENCYQHYPDCRMMPLDEFYGLLRNGAAPKTTQINAARGRQRILPRGHHHRRVFRHVHPRYMPRAMGKPSPVAR